MLQCVDEVNKSMQEIAKFHFVSFISKNLILNYNIALFITENRFAIFFYLITQK
jgi:hypothetical protein